VKGVPARARFDRAVVPDVQILQREQKKDVPSGIKLLGYLAILGIALFLVTLIGWALARVASAASGGGPPRREPRPEPARPGAALTT
jgi:hypothetical protein